jgi:uncharacterized protein (TIGR00730 family)
MRAMRKNRGAREGTPTQELPGEASTALPWSRPKPVSEDAAAPALVRALVESANYREADRDVEFLDHPDNRGVRLQLDYAKAERLLRSHGVAHTIVVLGSARIPERSAALRQLRVARKSASENPGDAERRQQLEIAERTAEKSRYYDVAREFGRLVGRHPDALPGGRLAVLTGGGPGIMEAANRGAHDVKAKSVGLNISLPAPQFPNPYLTPDLCLLFHYFAIRKLHFLLRARALVAFPGGYGTFDELFEVLTLVQTGKVKPLPVVLVGEEYWRQAFNIDFLVAEGVIAPKDAGLLCYAETAEQIWGQIRKWHRRRQPGVPG